MRGSALLAALVLAACGGSGSSSDTVDASTGQADAPANPCRPKVATVGSGRHNPGQDCMGPCHNHGFTAAGTVFAAASSSTPVSGATVRIVDANNQIVEAISQANGNFYTSIPLTFPVSVYVSSCPTVATMTDHITASSGCNATGACHGGTQGKIHLP